MRPPRLDFAVRRLIRAYEFLVVALACAAGVIPLFLLFSIVYSVVVRNFGLLPPIWTQAYSEYGLLFCTMLAAPWLVRIKAHVFVESFVNQLPPLPRRIAEKLVYALCIFAALVLFYFALKQFVFHLSSGEFDTRSVDMPRWLLFLPLPLSFLLMAIEFARYLVGVESMYAGHPANRGNP